MSCQIPRLRIHACIAFCARAGQRMPTAPPKRLRRLLVRSSALRAYRFLLIPREESVIRIDFPKNKKEFLSNAKIQFLGADQNQFQLIKEEDEQETRGAGKQTTVRFIFDPAILYFSIG